MAKYVIDAGVAIRLAAEGVQVSPEHELLAPTLIRSQMLSQLHEAVRRGELDASEAERRLDGIAGMRIRLLGDRVLRRTAWRFADQLGWESTFTAEYVALTRLQGDALVTLDERLARELDGVVPTAPYEALLS